MSDVNVAGSVKSIVSAFASGLDIFKKIRNRRRKKNATGRLGKTNELSQEEIRLNASLRRGSRDVQQEYERNYTALGKYYARGDGIAHASLCETLLKLNTGLVRIISSFLSRGKHEIGGDCRSLTALSNSSRLETLDALSQLYTRLAGSAMDLHVCGGCQSGNSGRATHKEYRKSRSSSVSANGRRTARRTKAVDKNPPGATITRRPVEGSSTTQLAIVRPRNQRTTSSCSGSSISTSKSFASASTVVPTPPMSPVAHVCSCHGSAGPHGYAPQGYAPHGYAPGIPPARRIESGQGSTSRPSTYADRPQTWPNRLDPQGRPPAYQTHPTGPAPPVKYPQYEAPLPRNDVKSRRRHVETPSTYSFASDSTKLGEIPMHKWTKPFDYEEMERLNSLTEKMDSVGISNQGEQAKESGGKKKGFWKLFKGREQGE